MRKYILDTDIGPDCDDCGALAMFDRFHKAGLCVLLAVTHCTSDILSTDVIASINEWYGVDVPIGQTDRKDFLDGKEVKGYTAPVSELYRKTHKPAAYEQAIPLMRRLLANNRDVTLVLIGPFNNMRELLLSEADEYSPLNGIELVRQSVREVIAMGGNFTDLSHGEYNIFCDIPAAQLTAEKCPVPITYCGFEAGVNVMTGATLESCPEENPVRLAYKLFCGLFCGGGFTRNSWDLVTVYYALCPDDERWILSDECELRFNGDATAVIKDGSGARTVRFSDERALEVIINGIIDGTAVL